jgi:hypothetical protein
VAFATTLSRSSLMRENDSGLSPTRRTLVSLSPMQPSALSCDLQYGRLAKRAAERTRSVSVVNYLPSGAVAEGCP